ncbi:MAG: hypothetical protein JRI76_11515 [Deltaproteobacteria bacterium]|nr:hypothetical protein [Deltaproteobacteria bacterium]MBW1955065.1 hypothetical protein [Deltaproteobacteria bacterium]MBW2042639.1 hypothetical protein [Deltaproteobacteria bacterium]MBW2133189.1 hypothetical protein [Deltaproteobacteria bacterium]
MTEDQRDPTKDPENKDEGSTFSTRVPPGASEDVIVLTRTLEEALEKHGAVSRERLEAALEQVVRKVFSRKIDKMLMEIMDQAVTREMERIRSLVLSEASPEEENP